MRNRYLKTSAASLLSILALGACNDESLSPPAPVSGMFARYVSLGNSLTAGYQSGGINDSTQRESYAVLLAEVFGLRVDKDFHIPSMANPGCPPPLVNVFQQSTVDTLPPPGCAGRASDLLPAFINNVAVPGAKVIDPLTNIDTLGSVNPLTTFFLGGLTQVEAALRIAPTFASVWIGNNDVLGALLDTANAGNPSLITSQGDFASRYAAMIDSLRTAPTLEGGVLIGVIQVVFAPYASTGSAWFATAAGIDSLTVLPNCLEKVLIIGSSDSAEVLVPFAYGAPLFAQATDPVNPVPTTLDCAVPQVVSAFEASFMTSMVKGYNQTIAQIASNVGWAYLDPNPILENLLQDPMAIRSFPAFDPTDPQHETAPFGTALSRDGFHPSAGSHVLVMQTLLDAIDLTYQTTLARQ